MVEYLRAREQEDPQRRVVVVIPEVQPEHWWRWFLHNQRGFVLNRAIVAGTDNVVVCRLRFRLRHLAPTRIRLTLRASRPADHRGIIGRRTDPGGSAGGQRG